MHWEDESKSLQARAFFRKEVRRCFCFAASLSCDFLEAPNVSLSCQQLFVEYDLPWIRKEFGLQFGLLVDTLQVFTAGSAELVLRYPGANQELICE